MLYSEADGMINDYVNSIVIDDNDDIWIGTNKGLCKFDTKKINLQTLIDNYGIQGSNLI